ncbi:Carboxylesterase NlhH [Posidoniimonas corsicana]|uniref:Carboxylesterase NlhH n=1 Tax=Posidoniimonas corsicana TaxID=1938618 RepID=A0A5C5V892_9BACT|nr:alpha/beta hydrolase [Posidoniimonas corsicana]TWT33965.1 Carboxylesterase NlhH [Posidoniimonas corsicana]
MRLLCSLAVLLLAPQSGAAAEPAEAEVPYKQGADLTDYERARCVLDIYPPATGAKAAPVVVFFHGGSITGGDKQTCQAIADLLTPRGVIVVSANYRLSPSANYPDYVEDAAAAVRWVHANIADRGGDPGRLYISGHSAGGYLTMMAAAALGHYQPGAAAPDLPLAGLIPIAGQTVTHSTVRQERGLGTETIVVDSAAPLGRVRQPGPPMLLVCGDHDLPRRLQENQLLLAHLRAIGDARSQLVVGRDRDHGTIYENCDDPGDPAGRAIVEFILGKPPSGEPRPAKPEKPPARGA